MATNVTLKISLHFRKGFPIPPSFSIRSVSDELLLLLLLLRIFLFTPPIQEPESMSPLVREQLDEHFRKHGNHRWERVKDYGFTGCHSRKQDQKQPKQQQKQK